MSKSLKIRKMTVPYEELSVPVGDLAFYPENPRIYSQFSDSDERTQEGIQEKLQDMDHVKELRSQIDLDGQVNEPLFCMPVEEESELHGKHKYLALEGNSRLAAVRMEKKGGPLPPTQVPCNILDFSGYNEQDTERIIFLLLGQMHIQGKTNWQTYESAAYIYRRHKFHKVPAEEIAEEIRKSKSKVYQMIEAYELMNKASDSNLGNWSYYEAYISSSKIGPHRKNLSDLDDRVIELINKDKFHRALEMRDKLPVILGNKRAKEVFFDKEEDEPFKEAFAIAEAKGDANTTIKRLERFRRDIGKAERQDEIEKLLKRDSTKGQTSFELKKIAGIVNKMLEKAP